MAGEEVEVVRGHGGDSLGVRPVNAGE
ncbi:hypothetical protein Q604_UNBC18374G0002, partial [human gut metagenome]